MSQSPPPQPDDQPAAGDTVQGDHVHGDKIAGHQIRVGDITNSAAIAVGVNVTQNIQMIDPNTARADLAFEQRYCQAIIQRLDRLELFGLPRLDQLSSQQPLSVAYINLAFVITAEHVRELSRQLASTLFQRRFPNRTSLTLNNLINIMIDKDKAAQSSTVVGGDHAPSALRLSDPALLRELFLSATLKRFVIQGKAGSGKSTLLQWLAIQHALLQHTAENSQPSPLVPFFLRLREFVGRGFPAPEDFPRATVPHVAGNMPHGWVHRLLETGRAVILVDGVDEMPQGERPALLQSLQALITAYPQVTYLVTSRPAAVATDKWPAWTAWIQTEEFLPLMLDDMTPDQADHLIDHWHQALCHQHHHEERSKILTLAASLKRQLITRPELRRLTVSPLLCAMLCAVHHDRRQDLPRERALLYQECVELLLNRRDQGRKIEHSPDYPNLSELQKHEVIQSLAYWFLKNGYSTAEFAEIDTHIDSLLRLMQVGAATSEGVRRLLIERSSLLREPVAGWVDFPHRTFLEYLAAQAAVKASDFGVLLDHARDDQWRETIILAMGAARPDESTRFLQRLIKKADSFTKNTAARHQLYLLAAACLETPVRRDPTVESLVVDRVRSLLPASDPKSVSAFAKVGPTIVPLLAPDSDYSSEEATFCIQVLAEIATDPALDQLTAYTMDERRSVSDALSRTWQNFDQNLYIERVFKKMKRLTLDHPPSSALLAKLLYLEELILDYPATVELQQFEVLTKLKSLDLLSTKIQNMSSLEALINLKTLALNSIQATDLTSLPTHRLKSLSINNSLLKDLTPLLQLHQLEYLILHNTQVTDLSALTHFPPLVQLHIDSSSSVQLATLNALSSLLSLTIWNNIISNIPIISLARFPLLRRLYLNNVTVHDYSIFKDVPQLNELILHNQVNFNLAALPDPTQLTTLRLHTRDSANIAFLPNLLNLRALIIGRNSFDLKLLHGLKHLHFLDTSNAIVHDLAPLVAIPNLTELTISAEDATNLRPLLDLPNLRRLQISGSGRIDRQTLQQLPYVTVERM